MDRLLENLSLESLLERAGSKLDSIRRYPDEEGNEVWVAQKFEIGGGFTDFEGKTIKEALIKLIYND